LWVGLDDDTTTDDRIQLCHSLPSATSSEEVALQRNNTYLSTFQVCSRQSSPARQDDRDFGWDRGSYSYGIQSSLSPGSKSRESDFRLEFRYMPISTCLMGCLCLRPGRTGLGDEFRTVMLYNKYKRFYHPRNSGISTTYVLCT